MAQRILRPIILGLLLTTIFGIAAAQQEPQETSGTWIVDYGVYSIPNLRLRFDRYSKTDVERFKEKLEQLKKSGSKNRWEGLYTYDYPDEVGIGQLRLSFSAGFAEFYVYSCMPELRHLKYGRVIDSADSVELMPDSVDDSPQKAKPVTYVKVSWGGRDYLVEESSLLAFAEKAAGVYVEPDDLSSENYQKWGNYWVAGNLESELEGLPKLPPRYKSYEREPITGKISSIKGRSLEKEIETGNNIRMDESAVYRIVLNVGSKMGVKKRLKFLINDTEEEIFITDVTENTAVGILVRSLDDKKVDYCLDDNGQQITCQKLSPSMTVSTKTRSFWW